MKRIKDSYQKQIIFFISINVIFFGTISIKGIFNIDLFHLTAKEICNPKSIFITLSPIIAVVFSGLLSNKIKEILVFWKIKNRLPGCRAFTILVKEDCRIDIAKLKIKIGRFPKDPAEQNRKWYSLYKSVKGNDIVIGSHKDFLFTRDLCVISFLFILFLIPVAYIFWEILYIKIYYTIFLILQYTVTAIAAKNYGNRFVCNVLAIVSQE